MEEESTLTYAQEQLAFLSEQRTGVPQCRCTCLHSGGDNGFFRGWGTVQCSTACVPTSSEWLESKSASKECVSNAAEGHKGGGTKVPVGKRRASAASSVGDKPRNYLLVSRSASSFSSQDLYKVRGAEVCYLQPHEQARYYRQKVTYDAARKGDVVHTHLPARKKREVMPITPQVATKGPGLQITPMYRPSGRSLDPQGTTSADSILFQAEKRTRVAKHCVIDSNGCGGGAKKKQDQDSRVHWTHSIKPHKQNHSVAEGELNKDGSTTKRSVLLQGRIKHQFTQRGLKMLQYRPDLKTYVRGAGWLEGEEEACSMPTLLDTTSGSEAPLSNPLKCFPLGPSVACKDQKQDDGSRKNTNPQKQKKKNSKGKNPSHPVIPALGHTVHGVVYNSQQPANLLQHRYQVSLMGMQHGFRYETLCLQGYGRSSPPLVVGPWITTSPTR